MAINIRPFKETSEQDKKNKQIKPLKQTKKAADDLPVCLSLSRLWI